MPFQDGRLTRVVWCSGHSPSNINVMSPKFRFVCAVLSLVHQQVLADGIPQALTYVGTLQTGSGSPVTTQQSVQLTLWNDAFANAAANLKCTTPAQNIVPDEAGRFRLTLDATCVEAVASSANLWVQLQVGGVLLSRTRLGAVPYAVEAAKSGRLVVSANNKRISFGGLFCGATASSTGALGSGADTGYLAAKALCERVSGCSSSAHMCNGEEAINSHLLGITLPQGWVRHGAYLAPTDDVPVTRAVRTTCGGFKIGSTTLHGASFFGATWDPVAEDLGAAACSIQQPVLCCD